MYIHLNKEDILKNFGGEHVNSLKNILQDIENDHEIDTNRCSQYYTLKSLPADISDTSSDLLVLSLNSQSILAKFGSFDVMIQILSEQNIHPDAILIQESWLENDNYLPMIQLE